MFVRVSMLALKQMWKVERPVALSLGLGSSLTLLPVLCNVSVQGRKLEEVRALPAYRLTRNIRCAAIFHPGTRQITPLDFFEIYMYAF